MPIAASLCNVLANCLISSGSVTILHTCGKEFECFFCRGRQFEEGMCEGEDLSEFSGWDRMMGEVEETYRSTGMLQGLGRGEPRFLRGFFIQERRDVDDGERSHGQENRTEDGRGR